MAKKYTIKEISNEWNLAKFYFPNIEIAKSKIYEIVFSRLYAGQYVEVILDVPEALKGKNYQLYFADGKGNITIVSADRKENKIYFSTNKVGLYILIENKTASSNHKFTQVIANASNFLRTKEGSRKLSIRP